MCKEEDDPRKAEHEQERPQTFFYDPDQEQLPDSPSPEPGTQVHLVYKSKLLNSKAKQFRLNTCLLLSACEMGLLKVLPRLDTITIQGFTSFRQHQEYYYGSDNHLRHYHYICGWLHTDNKADL